VDDQYDAVVVGSGFGGQITESQVRNAGQLEAEPCCVSWSIGERWA
jgi:succinate dehydrogenase/fumarate reductase flavoprotein subunit